MKSPLVLELGGIHHLTAISADAPGNHRFYTQVLGLRLVKKTVNQDDTSAYHLFYADGLGSPGTDLTFFDWPVTREQRGSGSVIRTGLRLASASSLEWWQARLETAGCSCRREDSALDFEDPEGQRLRLIHDPEAGPGHAWERSPVPAEHQILGLGPLTLSVRSLQPSAELLGEVLNMRRLDEHTFEMGPGGLAARLELYVDEGPRAHSGAGGVHHLALRTPDEQQYLAWAERLSAYGVRHSGPIDRFYFRSLYFREPGGILFEIATDGPGFAADEPQERLGERLSLPPFLEGKRAQIEAGLKPL